MKKIIILLIVLIFSSTAQTANKPKKSPLLNLPKLLQYEHYFLKEGSGSTIKKKKNQR